jgi:hypothetical protein
MNLRTVDDELSQLCDVMVRDRFRIRELLGEDWRDTDLVGLDVDVRRNN